MSEMKKFNVDEQAFEDMSKSLFNKPQEAPFIPPVETTQVQMNLEEKKEEPKAPEQTQVQEVKEEVKAETPPAEPEKKVEVEAPKAEETKAEEDDLGWLSNYIKP